MKLYFKKGGLHWIAQAKTNPEVFYFTAKEQDAHTFGGISEILDLLVTREFFKIQADRFFVEENEGPLSCAYPLRESELYKKRFEGCSVPAISDKVMKKILNAGCFGPELKKIVIDDMNQQLQEGFRNVKATSSTEVVMNKSDLHAEMKTQLETLFERSGAVLNSFGDPETDAANCDAIERILAKTRPESDDDLQKKIKHNTDTAVTLMNRIFENAGRPDLKIGPENIKDVEVKLLPEGSTAANSIPFTFPKGGVFNKGLECEFKIDPNQAGKAIKVLNKIHMKKEKKIRTGQGSKNTNEAAVAQIAAFYGITSSDVHSAVQIYIKGKEGPKTTLPEAVGILCRALESDAEFRESWIANIAAPHFADHVTSTEERERVFKSADSFLTMLCNVPEEDTEGKVNVNNLDDAFCFEMSNKISAFITDPIRRNLVAIMGIEKASGLPISTVSNFISGRRDRIPLHHIGPLVKCLEAIGFKA